MESLAAKGLEDGVYCLHDGGASTRAEGCVKRALDPLCGGVTGVVEQTRQ
jgi:hypothetical protein